MKRHEVQVLKRAGHSLTDIARQVGISRRAVASITKEPPVEKAAAEAAKVGRPGLSPKN